MYADVYLTQSQTQWFVPSFVSSLGLRLSRLSRVLISLLLVLGLGFLGWNDNQDWSQPTKNALESCLPFEQNRSQILQAVVSITCHLTDLVNATPSQLHCLLLLSEAICSRLLRLYLLVWQYDCISVWNEIAYLLARSSHVSLSLYTIGHIHEYPIMNYLRILRYTQ